MFLCALLGVSSCPFNDSADRVRFRSEAKTPINRFLIGLPPLVHFVLRYRVLTLVVAAVIMVLTIIPLRSSAPNSCPPLNEGTMLFMPTACPHVDQTRRPKSPDPEPDN